MTTDLEGEVTDDGDGQPPQEPGKVFTQAEVDQIVGSRAKQAKGSALAQILDELGADNIEAVKTTLATVEVDRQKELSDVQRLTEQVNILEQNLLTAKSDIEAEKANTQAKEDARQLQTIQNEFQRTAIKPEYGFNLDALNDLWAAVDVKTLTIDDDGKLTGVEAELKRIAEAKPWLLAQVKSTNGTTARHVTKTLPTEPAPKQKIFGVRM